MNGINRRGQKVVCVVEFEMVRPNGQPVLLLRQPKLGEVYTVTDFVSNDGLIDFSDEADLNPGILVAELGYARDRLTKRPIGWPIAGFRPRDERETDISALTGITVPKLEDA